MKLIYVSFDSQQVAFHIEVIVRNSVVSGHIHANASRSNYIYYMHFTLTYITLVLVSHKEKPKGVKHTVSPDTAFH